MKIISFAWTTPAILARRKTCTRREWNDRYARSFRAGELVQAYDKQPRFGGKPIAIIRLTRAPYYSDELPAEDYEREGFDFLTDIGAKVDGTNPRILWRLWRSQARPFWIVRFEIVSTEPATARIPSPQGRLFPA